MNHAEAPQGHHRLGVHSLSLQADLIHWLAGQDTHLDHLWCALQGLGAPEEDHLSPEERDALTAIRARKAKMVADHRRKKGAANAQAVLPRRAERERTANTATMKVSGKVSSWLTVVSNLTDGLRLVLCHSLSHDRH